MATSSSPAPPPADAQAPPQADPRRWLALLAIIASVLVLSFDTTILNVALPTMSAQIGADTGDMQWIVDSYTVVFAAAMLPAGLLGDRFGRRRMLVTGLVVFLAGSMLGVLAHSPGPVIAARTVMGVGGAFIMPLALSVLPSMFSGQERSRAVAIVSTAMALGMPLGPIIGGTLLEHFWWGSVFLINIPLVGLSVVACMTLLPETRDPAAPRVDVPSTVFAAGGLGALVFGIIEAPDRGWGDPLVLLMLFGGVALITGLVLRERGVSRPMLDLTLLRQRGFVWNAVAATLVTFILTGLLFVLPSYLQTSLGYDAFGTGLRLLPMMGGLMFAARAGSPLVKRFGPRPVIVGGLAVLAGAAFLGSTTRVGDGYGVTALWLSIAGLGFGLAIVPAMDSALGALPRERAGSGSGLLQTLRQTGGAIGVAILGSVLAAGYTGRLDTGGLSSAAAHTAKDSVVGAHAVAASLGDRALATAADAAYLHGMSVVLTVCGVASLVAAALVAAFLPNPRTGKATDGGAADGGAKGSGDGSGYGSGSESGSGAGSDTAPGIVTGAVTGSDTRAGASLPVAERTTDAGQ
ncbi:MFS transporter [Streptomyces sp. NPDC008079]|uniref:MFS transporter n=1 Tax=Streptomyces sp. NPDC008079 TaxID=3364806 RepID=UPI0036E74FC5